MVSPSVLNGRIYRAAFLPLLFALAIAAFSLANRPVPVSSDLAPDAFAGARAFAELQRLAARFPDRRPGSSGDRELAAYVAAQLRALGGTAGGGFSVAAHSVQAQTIEGSRTLTTIVARRPGNTGEPPIAIIAHRDAAAAPAAAAELSATTVLLELARVFAASETQRTIILVSTSGGSGGNAGARAFATHAAAWIGAPIDAAIALGDLAAPPTRLPFLAALSEAPGSAPALLTLTVARAIAQQAGVSPATPTLLDRLAQLSFPLAGGEQGPLLAHGVPAVLLQAGSELPPPSGASPSAARLEGLGRAVLSAVYALDTGPEVAGVTGGAGGLETSLPIERKLLPEWAVRLLVLALLLPPLLTTGDGIARLRRRRRSERSLARWTLWVAACGLPFLLAALFAMLLGGLGVLAAPRPPVPPGALPLRGSAIEALLAVTLVLLLAWLAWPALLRRLALPPRPSAAAAGLALMTVLGALAAAVWAIDPFTALLLVPALHLWLLLAAPERPALGRSPSARLAPWPLVLVVLGAAPLALLIAFYAQRLDLGPGGVAHTALLLLASGRIGVAGAALWSIAAGCLAAALLLALAPPSADSPPAGGPYDGADEHESASIRGGWVGSKSFYAGPGSLGGTESALRR
jgi:hypothetical protein